jgi:hypothetical protein
MSETTVRPTDREWIRTLEAELAALRKGLKAEVDRQDRELTVLSDAAQEYPKGTRRRADFRAKHEAVGKERERLRALLDSSGGK